MGPLSNRPIIQLALGDDWNRLHPSLRREHDITPGIPGEVVMRGTLYEVFHSRIAKVFVLPARLFGALVHYKGYDVPTTVRTWTTADDPINVYWQRSFHFPDRPPVIFASRMAYLGGREVIEYVRGGLGLRMRLSLRDERLVYTCTGYQWNYARLSASVPSWALLGGGSICQYGFSPTDFQMAFHMHHPLYGRTFAFSGEFRIE